MKEDKLIEDWLNEKASTVEKTQLEAFISSTEKLEVPSNTSKDEAWSRLMDKIELESSSNEKIIRAQKRNNSIYYWAAAAALVLISVFGFLFNRKTTTVTAHYGELASITLPDSSIVMLNSGSSLSFKEKSFNLNRRVKLSGEAFFKVVPGESFIVEGEKANVKVLGTSFNVHNRLDAFKVSVFTGKVEVASSKDTVLLTKGKEAILAKGMFSLEDFNMSQTATWRTGSFYFDSEPLKEVINELERQFDITIEVKADISQRFYSGYFNKANMEEALQLVFVPMGLSIETNGKKVTIK